MLVYRFRVTSEEYEDFLREIDIQPGQTFYDFHVILFEVSELRNCDRASFFITDRKYKKHLEITLKQEKRQVRKFDEDIGEMITAEIIPAVMKHTKLKNLIEDPHQKMIYEFQWKNNFSVSFQIELFKILQSDGLHSYPCCLKQSGEVPKPVITSPPAAKPSSPPTTPKPAIPKPIFPVVPRLDEVSISDKLDGIEENEEELAEIENHINEILEAEAPEVFESSISDANNIEESSYEGEEHLEYIEDYGDIDQFESRYKNPPAEQEQEDY